MADEDKLGRVDPVEEAAFTLCLMKHRILDDEAAQRLLESIMKNHAKLPRPVGLPPLLPTYASSSTSMPVVDEIYKKAYGHCDKLAKRKVQKRKKPELDNDIIHYRHPEKGYSIDGTRLPRFPELGISVRFLDHDRCTPPFEKQLTASDVDPNQHRLTLSKEFVKNVFLPKLISGVEVVVKGIPVIVYDQDGIEHEMKFKCWSDENVYILTEGWKAFLKMNGLIKLKNWVRVWMFRNRETNGLCFAINWINMPATIKLVKA